MRWTRLAIAVVIAACAKGERDHPSQSASDSAAGDSAMAAATMPTDSSAVAATSDTVSPKKVASGTAAKTKSAKSDTSATARTGAATTGAPGSTGPTGAEAMMGQRPAVPPRSLSKDQMKQLQTALKKDSCYKGTPDGVGGPGTQDAIACGLEKYKLTPNDMSGLYKKLGLKF